MKLTIEELLLKKNFSNLSFEEKQFVLSKISDTEYSELRFLLTNSKESFKRDFEALKVNDSTKEKLSIAFKKKYIKEKIQPVHVIFWNNYKNIIKPVLSLGVIMIPVMLTINNTLKNNALLSDINNVTTFLNEKKEFLKINNKHSSDLIDSNKFYKDSILEMNNYLRINTEGLYLN
ncbi:hypothetical protein [Flavivirga jejuensis]|uniref:Uncharacterized protein n=1 Tax=Flavivirga jejuensis TaxID=870487 RepID=A0ABT8WRQ3_9FLAO|nr:hypothetical protein [Flavivirga jejuensis]MDO5975654.1 hypothetical protein [Flavivirga jejuensis]